MFTLLRADPDATFEKGPFHIRHVRPGHSLPDKNDTAFGPLAGIDHANLGLDTLVKMHEHKNDEILSYMWRGSMVHEDTGGERIMLSPQRLMMMNAGQSFWHEESTPKEAAEMLQIFIRPRAADLEGRVQFMERPDGGPENIWTLLAAPEGENAPLHIRQQVCLYDIKLEADQETVIPKRAGFSPFLYVVDGEIEVAGQRLHKGDGLGAEGTTLAPITAQTTTTLVCFLVDLEADDVLVGSISGK